MARELAMSARNFDAAEALQIGFVSKIYDNKAKTVQAAIDLAYVNLLFLFL